MAIQINLRVSSDLRDALQAAAEANDVSMNREINSRLDRSLDDAQQIDKVFENRALYGVLRMVAHAMNSAGQTAAFHSSMQAPSASGHENWQNDPHAFDQAVQAANRIFDALRPPGEITLPKFGKVRDGDNVVLDLGQMAANLGQGLANELLHEVAADEPTTSAAVKRAPEMRRDLGETLVDRIKAFVGREST